mgnify:CR=1 FL=1
MDKESDRDVWLSDNTDTLIEDYEGVLEYPPELPDAYSHHNYWMLTKIRTTIERLGLSEDERVKALDRELIKKLKKYGPPAYREKERPDYWWWHLDEIYKGTYPKEKLPEHLRDLLK